MDIQYTVYLTRTDNGEEVYRHTFPNYDSAYEFSEIWANGNGLAYCIVEHNKEG